MAASPSPVLERRSEPDLFFPSSDSEGETEDVKVTTGNLSKSSQSASGSRAGNGHILRAATPPSRSAQANGTTKPPLSPDDEIVPLNSHSQYLHPSSSASVAGPSRKRPSPSRTPSSSVPVGFQGGYLGEFVCEGWSLSKGKGYCSPGSKIKFERPKAAKSAGDTPNLLERSKEKAGPTKLVGGKVVNAKGKPIGGKQVTLGSMMAKKAANAVGVSNVWIGRSSSPSPRRSL